MVGCMLLLFLHVLLLSGTTLADENPSWRGIPPRDGTFPADGQGPDEEDLMKTYGQLKSMYYSLKAKLDRKTSLQQEDKKRSRIFGSNNVAMSPLFLDLDNIETFNDISSFDTPTAATEATTSTLKTTTTGPIILGQDALGRQIVRFINQWEEQINDITGPKEGTSVVTWPITTPSTTVTTTTPTTTTTTTTPTATTTATTTQPTTTAAPVVFPSFLQHNRDEEASFPIRPDPLIMGPRPPVPIFDTTVSPPPIVSIEQEREEDPLIMGPSPPPIPPNFTLPPPTLSDFQTTSFFSRVTPTPFFDESTFPSFITEVTEPPKREEDVWMEFPSPSTTPPSISTEDAIWWTPRPAFLNMSSILMAPPPEPIKPIAPQPLWHPRRKQTTLPPPSSSTIHPEIEPKIRKVAEQSVVNDLELAAGSLNMPELVKELRGEQQIPPVLDYLQMEKILEMKRKTLEQLEILEQLANRRNRLQDLIENQKRLLNQARGNRIQQVEETAEVNRIEPTEQPKRIEQEMQIPTTISAIPEGARWPKRRRKGDSGKKRRQRPRHSRRPKMVDDRVPTVNELTQLLETELKQAQRDAKIRELRELCSQTMCSFEKGDFCRFETSYDEVTRRQKNRRRNTRSVEVAPLYVIRSWSNWVGSFSPNGTRVDRAPHFSPENKRFAGVFLEPQQLASLTLTVSYADTFTVRFRAWEATKGMRLRVCCDDFCPFSTDIGRSRRKWRQLRATCPAETRQLAFECEMVGSRRKGVCAIDDVFVEADECPAL